MAGSYVLAAKANSRNSLSRSAVSSSSFASSSPTFLRQLSAQSQYSTGISGHSNRSMPRQLSPVAVVEGGVLVLQGVSEISTVVEGADGQNQQQHGTSWVGVSWILLADVVGTSVMTLGYVAAQLGWILVITFLLAALVIAVYTAILMSQTNIILRQQGFNLTSMGDAAFYTLGGQRASVVVLTIVYGYAFLGNSTYLLVLGESLQAAVCGSVTCDWFGRTASVVGGCCFCLPFICSVRKVSESTTLCFANLLCILVVLGILIGSMITQGPKSECESPLVAPNLNFKSLFGASTNVLYGYAGHWLYFELMHTMEAPETFPLVFVVNAPLQGFLYLGTACISYYYLGVCADTDGIQFEMPSGTLYRIAQGLLFVHVGIVFLIKSVVLTRFLATYISPDSDESGGIKAWFIHIMCAIGLLIISGIFALVVPFFTLFLGLVGGLFAAPISYVLPVLFYCGTLGRIPLQRETGARQLSRSLTDKIIHALSISGSDVPADFQEGELVDIPPFTWTRLQEALTLRQFVIFTVLMIMSVFVTCVGSFNQITLIIEMSADSARNTSGLLGLHD